MRSLHLITRDDPTAEAIVAAQTEEDRDSVIVIDLRKAPVDYDVVLDEIFQADSIHVC